MSVCVLLYMLAESNLFHCSDLNQVLGKYLPLETIYAVIYVIIDIKRLAKKRMKNSKHTLSITMQGGMYNYTA